MVASRVVGEGDWVIFPLQQNNTVDIEWWQEKKAEKATYYMDKCWFGKPAKDENSVDLYTGGLKAGDLNVSMTGTLVHLYRIFDRRTSRIVCQTLHR